MQGNDLKEARKALGLTQGELAEQLGLSSTFVGLMERDAKPIERRTELAVQHLVNANLRFYGSHRAIDLEGDVPIARAMILWDCEDRRAPPVKVVGHSDQDDRRYSSSYGACNAEWLALDDAGRLSRLLSRFVELTVGDGLKPAEVHRAFSVIPEYREAMVFHLVEDGVEI